MTRRAAARRRAVDACSSRWRATRTRPTGPRAGAGAARPAARPPSGARTPGRPRDRERAGRGRGAAGCCSACTAGWAAGCRSAATASRLTRRWPRRRCARRPRSPDRRAAARPRPDRRGHPPGPLRPATRRRPPTTTTTCVSWPSPRPARSRQVSAESAALGWFRADELPAPAGRRRGPVARPCAFARAVRPARLRCRPSSPRSFSSSTSALTSWARSRGQTSTASGVSTMIRSLDAERGDQAAGVRRPRPGARCPAAARRLARPTTSWPTTTLPAASAASTSPRVWKSPTSFQPKSPGTVPTRPAAAAPSMTRVVDRDLAAASARPRRGPPRGPGCPRPAAIRADAGVQLRLLAGQLGQEDVDPPDEHAGVPQVVAGLHVAPRRRRSDGFSLNSATAQHVAVAGRLAALQVAVAGLGVGRGDADASSAGRPGRPRSPCGSRLDEPVARRATRWSAANEPMTALRVAPGDHRGGEADRGARVARRRLDEDVLLGQRRRAGGPRRPRAPRR